MSYLSAHAITSLVAEALRRISGPAGLRVSLNQFSTNLLYLPVYEVLRDVQQELGTRLDIRLYNWKQDDLTTKAVFEAPTWPNYGDGYKELTLGLSELNPQEPSIGAQPIANDRFQARPFIKRLPLWGIALVNNKKINWFKNRSFRHGLDSATGAAERDTRFEYWKVFGGKLSLLQVQDLTSTQARLAISLYPKGTTARRLFEDFLQGNGIDLHNTGLRDITEVTTENEFDRLFDGRVDIALTVQPWEAIRQSICSHKQEVEVVYVHQGAPQEFSSLYLKRPDTVNDQQLLDAVLDAMNLAIQAKVANFYDATTAHDLHQRHEAYTFISGLPVAEHYLGSSASRPSEHSANIVLENESFSCALHILSDSRIYYYESGLSDLRRAEIEQRVVRLADAADFVSKYKIGSDSRGIVRAISKIIRDVEPIKNHDDTLLSALYPDVVETLKSVANILNVEFNDRWSCDQLKENWRCQTFRDFFEKTWHIVEKGNDEDLKNAVGDDLWKVTAQRKYYMPWVPKEAIRVALMHFDKQFSVEPTESSCELVDFQHGYLGPNEDTGCVLPWMYVTYKSHGKPFSWDQFSRSKFCDGNRHGEALLDAWWINGSTHEIRHIFTQPHSVNVQTFGDALSLTYYGQDAKLGCDPSNYGLLLTFEVFPFEICAQ